MIDFSRKDSRLRIGLTQRELAELAGVKLRAIQNYAYQNSYNPMHCRKRRYGYTNVELSRALHISEESVRHVAKKMVSASVSNYERVKQLFMEEAQRVHQ